MWQHDLREQKSVAALLTTQDGLERLLGLMRLWWRGRTLLSMSREYGISRQRAGLILARVGCTKRLWLKARRETPDSWRRARRQEADSAYVALLSPLAERLTVRQRCALAWRAMELVPVDIARRMATSPQNVRRLLEAARWRLERQEASSSPKLKNDVPLDMGEVDLWAVDNPIAAPEAEAAKDRKPAPVANVPEAANPELPAPLDVSPDMPAPERQAQGITITGGDVAGWTEEPAPVNEAPDIYIERYGTPESVSETRGPLKSAGAPLRLSDLQRAKRGS